MIRWAPSHDVASVLATEPRGRSAEVIGRFAPSTRRPAFWIALWAVAVASELAALAPIFLGDESAPGFRIVFRLIGGAFAACGLVAWRRRPDSRSGMLMFATGLGLFVEPIFGALDVPVVNALGDMLEDVWGIFIIALLLTFLTAGRLETRVDLILVGAFVAQLVIELGRHLFLAQDGNFLLVHADAGVAGAFNEVDLWLASISCLAVAGVIGARWKRASRPRRRALLPSVAGISCLLFFALVQQAEPLVLKWLAVLSLLTVPAAFLFGLLRSRLAAAGVAGLFRDLRSVHGDALQARLAQALGDPSLVLAHRLPGSLGYADAGGRPIMVPAVERGRSTAPLERDGEDIAALIYDAALDEDPELVQAVGAAATLALENEHLHAETQAQLAELQASRQRLIAAGDAERRRLERNLHDGAQQRLVALAMQLRLVQADIRSDPATAEARIRSAGDELASSLEELRELARGLHPAVLDHGLPAALDSLAGRCTVPTAVACDELATLPEDIELAVYFVACEALANVGKYAQASAASVRLSQVDGFVAVEVADDGVGGADGTLGSGLRGLTDRVQALGGRLLVTSPPGEGTVVTAELPCAS